MPAQSRGTETNRRASTSGQRAMEGLPNRDAPLTFGRPQYLRMAAEHHVLVTRVNVSAAFS